MKKAILFAAACLISASACADTCPTNLNGKKFNSLSEYNQYKQSLASEYTMPDLAGAADRFPITFHGLEWAYMYTNGETTAPFTGKQLTCYIAWTDKLNNGFDDMIKVNHPIKTTSSNWIEMDDTTARCMEQNDQTKNCTFERLG